MCDCIPPNNFQCALDALPSILLRIPSLKKVHRHGNHNYFKSTFMWYHTDVTGRILPTNPAQEDVRNMLPPVTFEPINLQNICSKAIIASRVNFYRAEIPYRLKIHIGDMINYVNLCEKCNGVKNISESGFKVFTFKNPYLGNTCVPFLHWTCDYECASEVEVCICFFKHDFSKIEITILFSVSYLFTKFDHFFMQ